jgi:hypothetical protein
MATMLSDKGIPMHWTTIAKIEKNDRSVRIDEAAGIADLDDPVRRGPPRSLVLVAATHAPSPC